VNGHKRGQALEHFMHANWQLPTFSQHLQKDSSKGEEEILKWNMHFEWHVYIIQFCK
jgi:hypothetical protein